MNTLVKRSRQFLRALFSKMEPVDHNFVRQHLNEVEIKLFYNMDLAVQKHCVNVARTVIQMAASNRELNLQLLIKAALIHDAGKTKGSLTIVDRVIYVIISKISPRLAQTLARSAEGRLPGRFRKTFHVHITHGETGAALARENGLGEELVYLLRNHHNKKLIHSSRELLTLFQADEIN